MGGRLAPYALPLRPRLGSSNVWEHAPLEPSSSASLSRQPELRFRPVPECLWEFHRPATLPSIDPDSSESNLQSSHPRDYQHSTLADLTSSRLRQRQNCRTQALPSWDRVRSAPDFQRGPQGPHYRGDPVGAASCSQDPLDQFPAEPRHGGTFITTENVNHYHRESGITTLHRAVALEALYDSAESFPQPRCHPETRTKILDDLYSWAIDDDNSHAILWLCGPAGAGKSAVMQTLCQRLHDADRLGGSFFFKRGHTTCGNAKVLFATLAYQLALHRSELNGPISRSAETDPSVIGRGMDVQLRSLILEPCKLLKHAPQILLIDGLDECEGQSAQQEILRLIGSTATTHPRPLRILISSRPESHIREKLEESSLKGLYRSLNIEQAFKDVRRYLRDEFSRIHRQHHETMQHIPTPWPTWDIFEVLVDKSSGYFIYAATIIKFIDDRDFRPTERLAAVIENLPTECGTPFHALDKLYSQILCDVPSQSLMLDILCVIVHGSMLRRSTKNIERLLGLNSGDVRLTLRRLQSLLLVPQDETDVISLHHKSFPDFLIDPNRSGKFHLQCKDMARLILQALSQLPTNKAPPSSTFIAWEIGIDGLRYITSEIPPSVDLLPLIQTINFDFLWYRRSPSDLYKPAKELICWLKVSHELVSILLTHLNQEMFTPTRGLDNTLGRLLLPHRL
ncbi:hypothetical protein FB451DRAFT_722776 [Mycena latifolia]|nr:hypothetical protein FB451DRAFT_722776 [Mycena latifolia]